LKYKLLIKNIFVSLIFIFNSNLNIQAYGSDDTHNSEVQEYLNNLNVDYLKNFPKNDFYILGPGDTLKILVSREYPSFTSISTIDGEGTIYLPRLNKVYVEGLTVNELNNLLNKAFKEFVKFSEVETIITTYRPISVLVKGEVENPGIQRLEGAFSLKSSSNLKGNIGNEFQTYYFPSVFDVLRASGGITQFSDLSNIKLIRKNNLSDGGGQITTTLNFEKSFTKRDNSGNIRIFDGDIIEVRKSAYSNKPLLTKAILNNINPKFINVFVGGRVNRPGYTQISRASALSDPILLAGGTNFLKGKVTFIRFNNDGSIENRKFGYNSRKLRGSFQNPYMRDGDIVFVGKSFFNLTNEVLNEVTNPIRGIFSSYALLKMVTD
tara:strand:+ start:436 stop:1572 length:1137 start_codon:yes stop_codon:yes gene_type:complete